MKKIYELNNMSLEDIKKEEEKAVEYADRVVAVRRFIEACIREKKYE